MCINYYCGYLILGKSWLKTTLLSSCCRYLILLKPPSCKKDMVLEKAIGKKKMWNPRWQTRNGCDGRLMAKILIKIIQCCPLHVSLVFGTKFTSIVIIKIFAISLSSQPFLCCQFGFYISMTMAFFRATHFFTAGLLWVRFLFILNCILCS